MNWRDPNAPIYAVIIAVGVALVIVMCVVLAGALEPQG